MTFRLPLHDRRRYASAKRDRYHRDPEYRLRRINEARTRKGLSPAQSLEEVELRR